MTRWQDAHELYRKAVSFVDAHDLGWAMTRWPQQRDEIGQLAKPQLPTAYRLDSTRQGRIKHAQAIADALLNTHPGVYWGRERTVPMVRRQLEETEGVVLLFAKEDGTEEVAGFARVVTDHVDFAYLCDVFVMPHHYKKGLAGPLIFEATENTGGEGRSRNFKWWLWTGVSTSDTRLRALCRADR